MDSPESLSSLSTDNSCQICSQPAHGNHFGVLSCRACSAFFRRAIVEGYEGSRCRQLDGRCQARRDGRFNCKICRLRKCYDAGMSVDKLQFDRDLISSTKKFLGKRKMLTNIPHSPENFLGRPSFIFSCEPDLATSYRTFIDVQFFIDNAANFFISNSEPRRHPMLINMSTLDRLTYALDVARVPGTENPIVCTTLGKNEFLMCWEYKFLATANWLTYCDEFQRISQEMKIKFLTAIWYVWMKIEKIGHAAGNRIRSHNQEVGTMYHVINNVYIDIDKLEMDTSWMSNYSSEQLEYFLDKPCRSYQNRIVDPLINLRASPQEITYMICLVSFRYAAKLNPGPIADLAENLVDILAHDLHSYYFNVWKLSNYASRMAKLMKIVQFVEQDIYDRKQRAEIARIFDIFTFEFSHPEMFLGI